MPLLSVHLITYNNEKYIEETVRSILNQEVDFEYEIVIGDDCSTDGTLNIINDLAKLNPSLFKIHRNETQLGIINNFKATLDRCSGTYVFDIAGDDYLKDRLALQKMVNTFNDHPEIGFIDCGYDRIEDTTNETTPFINKEILTSSKKAYTNAVLLGQIAPVGHCYKREALYEYVDFDFYLEKGISIEDYPILVNLIMHTAFKRIEASLLVYRVHDRSYSHKKNFDEMVAQKEEMYWLFNHFAKKYNFSEALKQTYYSNHYRTLLFLAGYFSNKKLGKEIFGKLSRRTLKDRIHYWSSQNKMFRKLISLRKKFL